MSESWRSATQTNSNDLTDRQMEIYRTIYESARDNGYQPSIREIGDAVGLASTNGVVIHLRCLVLKGWIGGGDQVSSRSVVLLKNLDGSKFKGFVPK